MVRPTKLNSRGMASMLKSGEVRGMLTTPAEKVLAIALETAPVRSGDYKASLHIEDDTTDRAVKRVTSGVFYGMVVEANTGHLARALSQGA